MFKFECKEKVKDTVTGFVGIVAARIEWMNGCIRYVVLSNKRTDEGKEIEATIDEQQLVSMEKPKKQPKRNTGGPTSNVSQYSKSHLRR